MIRAGLALGGAVILGALWFGPVAGLTRGPFSAHMTIHMGVVAIAAPMLAIAIAGGRLDPVARWPRFFNAVAASVVELIVVWGWHAPRLHHAARHDANLFALEQASFLAAGLWLWLAAFGGPAGRHAERAWTGVAGLLFTSIHMTLLGAIFAVTPRALYPGMGLEGVPALADQHLGGGLMLIIGGASYLAGGLWLAMEGLRQPHRSNA